MKRRDFTKVVAGIAAGVVAGSKAFAADEKKPAEKPKDAKHDCKGKNECKGPVGRWYVIACQPVFTCSVLDGRLSRTSARARLATARISGG